MHDTILTLSTWNGLFDDEFFEYIRVYTFGGRGGVLVLNDKPVLCKIFCDFYIEEKGERVREGPFFCLVHFYIFAFYFYRSWMGCPMC